MIMSFFPYIFTFIFNLILLAIFGSLSFSSKWNSLISSRRTDTIDWSDETKRRIILASLVKGVTAMELERQGIKNRCGEKAEVCWVEFGFELHGSPLVDKHDKSYYGAIFKNKDPYPTKSPKFIIAFRGTLLKPQTLIQDLFLDAKLIGHRLHKRSRVKDALDNVSKVIALAGGPENVWLTGHSLGSAISFVVGYTLVLNDEFRLETFLFNPPIVSSPWGLFFRRYLGGILKSLQQQRTSEEIEKISKKLSSWTPHLFINENDPICNGYPTCYQYMYSMGTSGALHSTTSSVARVIGRDCEPIHLVPSVDLTITKSPRRAHQLIQWFKKDLKFNRISYRVKLPRRPKEIKLHILRLPRRPKEIKLHILRVILKIPYLKKFSFISGQNGSYLE